MKNPHDIFNTLKKETLTPGERGRLFARLKEHQATSPSTGAHYAAGRVRSPWNTVLFTRGMPLMASFVALILVGGGVAQAAEGALPGDILYPVKTRVSEEVRGIFARGDDAYATLEAWKAERRLQEAQKLALRDALTETRKQQLETTFDAHAARVEERIIRVAEKDPALAQDLAVTFEASLAAHNAILASLDTTDVEGLRLNLASRVARFERARQLARGPGIALQNKSADVAVRAFSTAMAPQEIESLSLTQETPVAEDAVALRSAPANEAPVPAFEPPLYGAPDPYSASVRMLESVREVVEKAEALLKEVRSTLTEDEYARAEIRLKATKEMVVLGEAYFKDGEYENARTTLEEALFTARTLVVFLSNDTSLRTSPLRARVLEISPAEVDETLPLEDDENETNGDEMEPMKFLERY